MTTQYGRAGFPRVSHRLIGLYRYFSAAAAVAVCRTCCDSRCKTQEKQPVFLGHDDAQFACWWHSMPTGLRVLFLAVMVVYTVCVRYARRRISVADWRITPASAAVRACYCIHILYLQLQTITRPLRVVPGLGGADQCRCGSESSKNFPVCNLPYFADLRLGNADVRQDRRSNRDVSATMYD